MPSRTRAGARRTSPASALKEKGPQLLASEPTIERFDVLAAKLPAVALQQQ
jgi:hypothetical protein